MTRRIIRLLCLLLALPLAGHPQDLSEVPPAQDGGMREVLESIVIPPIPNAPFTATLVTEWARPTPDGGTITFVNQREVARDGDGRLYEERWGLVPKDSDFRSKMQWIQIADAQAHTLYNCNMLQHACLLLRYAPQRDLAAATAPLHQAGPMANGKGYVKYEDLGTKIVHGMNAAGTRETITLNPGAMGNDKPVVETRERWRSDVLAVNLISIVSGPLIGKQSFTITRLNPGPPDPALFQLPHGFAVQDQRPARPPSH